MQEQERFGRAALFGTTQIGHYLPYLYLFEAINNKYGLDNYTTYPKELDYLFNKSIRTNSSSKYFTVRPIEQEISLSISDALTLVFEIEELWKSNNYKPEVILIDCLNLTGRILSHRNQIPSVGLLPAYPYLKEQYEEILNAMYKKMDTMYVEQTLQTILTIEKKYGIEIQKSSQGFPFRAKFGWGDINLSIMPTNYPFLQEVDYICTGPMIRLAKEELNFDFTPNQEKKVIFVSLGTTYNTQADFFTKVIASCLKYLSKECIILISMMNQSTRETINKTFDEKELEKNGIFVRDFWDQIKVLEKTDLFVSHCGNNSYLESLSKAVPILAYPQAVDQFLIARDVKRLGFGDILPSQFDEEIFYDSVKAILFNPSFKEKLLSCIDWFDSEKSLKINMTEIENLVIQKQRLLINEQQ